MERKQCNELAWLGAVQCHLPHMRPPATEVEPPSKQQPGQVFHCTLNCEHTNAACTTSAWWYVLL